MVAPDEARVRQVLAGRQIAVCFGAGVDSTAMLCLLRQLDIVPAVITFADTGAEKPQTYAHVDRISSVLSRWRWPAIAVVKHVPMARTGYTSLYGNCWNNETLPSLAFGMKSCSLKWKVGPQDQYLKGVSRGPNARPPHQAWTESQRTGIPVLKLIGYDCGPADRRRSRSLNDHADGFDYAYPLQLVGWDRAACVQAIASVLGPDFVPMKSACTFCPASKEWELFWLAAHQPDDLDAALALEYRALTGRHSRFSAVEFGADWETLVRNAERFPSTNTCVGLGRSFSWCQWARVNRVVDDQFRVRRDQRSRSRFVAKCEAMGGGADNAYDIRATLRRGGLVAV